MANTPNQYGQAQYGVNVYGEVVIPSTLPGPCLTDQPGYCQTYTRFQFSGVNLGLYIFDLNPTNYTPFPQRTTQSYKTILNFDDTVDEQYDKIDMTLTWNEMSESMWNYILPYTRKNVDGTSESLYFWDGNFGRACGKKVKIESFNGQLHGGNTPIKRFNVSLRIRIAYT